MVMQWTVNPPSSGTTGSIPVQPTIFSVFSKMDITDGYGPSSGSSILSGPAKGDWYSWEHIRFAF